jgi:hypothetical protein
LSANPAGSSATVVIGLTPTSVKSTALPRPPHSCGFPFDHRHATGDDLGFDRAASSTDCTMASHSAISLAFSVRPACSRSRPAGRSRTAARDTVALAEIKRRTVAADGRAA